MSELPEEQFDGRMPGDDGGDGDLIRRICAGDADAIDKLLNKRCGSVIAFLAGRFSYPELGGDLYLSLRKDEWRKLTIWRVECSLERWIFKIAISLCTERARREKRIVFMEPGELLNHTGSVTPDFDLPLRRRDLLRAIQSLKDPRQRAILLGTLQNRPIAEMADTLRITRGNADVLKKRAIDRIKGMLQERGRVQNA
jgi:RNA polymerase sigma factor (sigma-70 family)